MRVYHDNLEELKRLLIGHSVRKVAYDQLELDDGRILELSGNEGCGGCISGHYRLHDLNDMPINGIMDVRVAVEDPPGNGYTDETVYTLFVLAQDERIERDLATFSGTDGNGYYGTGFWIDVLDPPSRDVPSW